MNANLNCEEARQQFALLLYGELSFDEEEQVEGHLDHCEPCRLALAQQKELHLSLDAVAVSPSPVLLDSSRRALANALDRERGSSWWRRVLGNLGFDAPPANWLRPVGAMALLSIGFLGAKLTPGLNLTSGNFGQMGLANLSGLEVRGVKPQQDGRLQIVFDEKRERTVLGSIDDADIRTLLMSAAKEAQDPSLRAQTVTILVNGADAMGVDSRGVEQSDVREALLFALEHDQNPSVRERAMLGLRRYTSEPAVQNALAEVLLVDADAGMRTQAIDLLNSHGTAELDRRIVGALQEVMSREDDVYVRERAGRMLRAIKASLDIY